VRDDVAGHRYPELCKRMFLALLKSLSVQNQDGERNSVALAIQDDAERMLQFTPHGWLVRRKNRDLCLLRAIDSRGSDKLNGIQMIFRTMPTVRTNGCAQRLS